MENSTTLTKENIWEKNYQVQPAKSWTEAAIQSMAEYAAQKCAIVAAEKDKEIAIIKAGHKLGDVYSKTNDVLIRGYENELVTKEAECQRLREQIIDFYKFVDNRYFEHEERFYEVSGPAVYDLQRYNETDSKYFSIDQLLDVFLQQQSPKEGDSQE